MRVSLGGGVDVTTTERWLAEIRVGRAFSFGTALGASVGNLSEIQLFNPAGSGVSLLLHRASVGSGTAQTIHWRRHDAALATLSGQGVNLLTTGPAGLGAVRAANPAAPDGTLVRTWLIPISDTKFVVDDWDYELAEGDGILFASGVVNVTLRCTFLWVEVPT